MYKLDNTPRDDNRFLTPSFSSTLLDQIYRSIDDDADTNTNFFRDSTVAKKHSRTNAKSIQTDTKVVVGTKTDKKSQHPPPIDHDQDALFFSSTSISSDSSSAGFSSSDTDSMSMSRASSRFSRVRLSASFRSEKQGMRVFDGFCRNSNTHEEHITVRSEEALIKSKSRALKIYNNLKKVKQPISPGGRVTSFLNSLFTNAKKTTNRSTCEEEERKVKSVRAASSSSSSSTCSSASSFSRSCLSKTSSSDRERLRNGVKRTVRFYPVSVIVGEDSRPCGQKRLCEEKGALWKIGHSLSMRKDEETSREFLKEYIHSQSKKNNGLVLKDLRRKVNFHEQEEDEEDDDDDDASSYASSDLFELDHLAVFGSSRYSEELPVYETTRVSTNRAIANGCSRTIL
ncbi:hypothetical protein VNO77_32362 [Canavalia gladiata]|uniref:Protein BIG GRAIN 1-like A n=1 Tax=Canavalia gladiata TaxID=3824 RepID=A0AAN9Q869_CANGL